MVSAIFFSSASSAAPAACPELALALIPLLPLRVPTVPLGLQLTPQLTRPARTCEFFSLAAGEAPLRPLTAAAETRASALMISMIEEMASRFTQLPSVESGAGTLKWS